MSDGLTTSRGDGDPIHSTDFRIIDHYQYIAVISILALALSCNSILFPVGNMYFASQGFPEYLISFMWMVVGISEFVCFVLLKRFGDNWTFNSVSLFVLIGLVLRWVLFIAGDSLLVIGSQVLHGATYAGVYFVLFIYASDERNSSITTRLLAIFQVQYLAVFPSIFIYIGGLYFDELGADTFFIPLGVSIFCLGLFLFIPGAGLRSSAEGHD
jgi:hypothetical protein